MPIIQEKKNKIEIELQEDKTEKKNVFSTSIENVKEINGYKDRF